MDHLWEGNERISLDMISAFGSLRLFVRRDHNRIQSIIPLFIHLQKRLECRSTSVATDEALCIGCLLNVDLEKIDSAPPHQRMKVIWSLMQEVGQDIIFSHSRNLEDDGFRWAPATLLQDNIDVSMASEEQKGEKFDLGHITPLGLHVIFGGFIFSCNFLSLFNDGQDDPCFKDNRGKWYIYKFRPTQVKWKEKKKNPGRICTSTLQRS